MRNTRKEEGEGGWGGYRRKEKLECYDLIGLGEVSRVRHLAREGHGLRAGTCRRGGSMVGLGHRIQTHTAYIVRPADLVTLREYRSGPHLFVW